MHDAVVDPDSRRYRRHSAQFGTRRNRHSEHIIGRKEKQPCYSNYFAGVQSVCEWMQNKAIDGARVLRKHTRTVLALPNRFVCARRQRGGVLDRQGSVPVCWSNVAAFGAYAHSASLEKNKEAAGATGAGSHNAKHVTVGRAQRAYDHLDDRILAPQKADAAAVRRRRLCSAGSGAAGGGAATRTARAIPQAETPPALRYRRALVGLFCGAAPPPQTQKPAP